MVAVRPYQFNRLSRLTRDQVALQQSVAALISARPFAPNFRQSLADMLCGHLKAPVEIGAPEIRPIKGDELASLLPELNCIAVVGAAPGAHKILVEVDLGLVTASIDRLLGGSGDSDKLRRGLTEIEEGVFSFIVLHTLGHLQNGFQTGKELALTLERFISRLDQAKSYFETEPGYQLIAVQLGLDRRVGYVRILVPKSLLQERFLASPAQSGGTPQEKAHMARILRGLGEHPVQARLEVAQLDLSPAEIANLEPGDIIVLENHQLAKTPEGIEGKVFVRVGAGQNGGFHGALINKTDHTLLQVVSFVTQENPLEEPMVESAASPPENAVVAEEEFNIEETEGLLRDIAAAVVVELGRLQMNTAQVARLRAGQILRLPRGPQDPVDLVVHGKVLARGELVDVEGELGVRLLHVAGAG